MATLGCVARSALVRAAKLQIRSLTRRPLIERFPAPRRSHRRVVDVDLEDGPSWRPDERSQGDPLTGRLVTDEDTSGQLICVALLGRRPYFHCVLEVTDMFVTAPNLVASVEPAVHVVEVEPGERSLLRLVAEEHPPFLSYYEDPTTGTTLASIEHAGAFVGGVLLERQPSAAESDRDAALAALFIAGDQRDHGLGSAAIVAASRLLLHEGYDRVLAQWVWSVKMYERLGFEFWRTRLVDR